MFPLTHNIFFAIQSVLAKIIAFSVTLPNPSIDFLLQEAARLKKLVKVARKEQKKKEKEAKKKRKEVRGRGY